MTISPEDLEKARALLSNDDNDIDIIISNTVYQLVKREPFYGACITGMQRSYDDKLPACAAVNIKNATPHLYINPKEFMNLNPLERCAVLKHEVLHVMFVHMARELKKNHKRWNIAADMAINQMIQNIPDWAIDHKNVKGIPEGLPPKLSAEQYYNRLPDDEEKLRIIIGDGPMVDSHDVWMDADDAETIQEVARSMAAEAEEYSRNRGTLPGEIQALLPDLMKKRRVPWNKLLTDFVATFQKVIRSSTWKRTNRRISGVQGARRLPGLNLLIIADTSGSVTDQELGMFFDEIDNIWRDRRNMIRVMECDTTVHPPYKYEGVKPKKVHGRGGTYFTPALQEAWKLQPRPDGIVYFTDGYGENPTKVNNIPVIWVVTPNGTTERCAQFGRIVRMDKKTEANK